MSGLAPIVLALALQGVGGGAVGAETGVQRSECCDHGAAGTVQEERCGMEVERTGAPADRDREAETLAAAPAPRFPLPAPRAPLGAPRAARPAEPDRWIAEDKWKHFFMSFGATVLAYGALRTAGLGDAVALPGAAAAAGAAGLWKERRDRKLTGVFSVRDLVWDAAGIGAGLGLAVQTR